MEGQENLMVWTFEMNELRKGEMVPGFSKSILPLSTSVSYSGLKLVDMGRQELPSLYCSAVF